MDYELKGGDLKHHVSPVDVFVGIFDCRMKKLDLNNWMRVFIMPVCGKNIEKVFYDVDERDNRKWWDYLLLYLWLRGIIWRRWVNASGWWCVSGWWFLVNYFTVVSTYNRACKWTTSTGTNVAKLLSWWACQYQVQIFKVVWQASFSKSDEVALYPCIVSCKIWGIIKMP